MSAAVVAECNEIRNERTRNMSLTEYVADFAHGLEHEGPPEHPRKSQSTSSTVTVWL